MLETKRLTKNFKGVQAVSDLDLNVNAGEIVGIIGPNGAGKTTIFNLITGYLQPTKGEIIFNGRDITGQKPHVIAKHGVVRTFQLDRIFHDFSIIQNVLTASYLNARIGLWGAALNTSGYRRKNRYTCEYAGKILKFMRLDDKKDEIARNLSHGHQKLLGIAIALAANPRVLLLDEPLGGMNPAEVDGTLEIIREIRKQGTAIILVEHDMQAVMKTCDRIVVLNFGMVIARGLPEEVQKNQEVIRAYLGTKKIYT
jgi:branched-chain amino acid transport system ATP-binding protein